MDVGSSLGIVVRAMLNRDKKTHTSTVNGTFIPLILTVAHMDISPHCSYILPGKYIPRVPLVPRFETPHMVEPTVPEITNPATLAWDRGLELRA